MAAHHRRRAPNRRSGDTPGLWVFERKRRLCPGLRRCGLGLHRAATCRHPRHGLEGCFQTVDGPSRCALGAGLPRCRAKPVAVGPRSQQNRLPGADQGQCGRRRQGHAGGAQCRRLCQRLGLVPARGAKQLWRCGGADRKIRAAPAPHRDPGVCRHPRPLHPFVRARLLGATPPPKGVGRGPRAGHDR